MELKEFFGLVATVIAAGVALGYIYTILKGTTRPHLYTFAIDAIVTGTVFVGAFVAGAGAGSWNLGLSTVLLFVIMGLSITHGTRDITRLDAFFATLALASIVPWILTKDPTMSVILASLTYLFSMLPTVRKTWSNPASEPWIIWMLNGPKHVFAIAATTTFSVTTLFYPIMIIVANTSFALLILYLRSRQKSAEHLD